MEENNRQRASDNGNEPLYEVDLTAVTPTCEESQTSPVETNSIIDLPLSANSVIGQLSSEHCEDPTFINTSLVNLSSQASELGVGNSGLGCSINSVSIEHESDANHSEFSNTSEPIIKQDLITISPNLIEQKNTFNTVKEEESKLPSQDVGLQHIGCDKVFTVDSTDEIESSCVETMPVACSLEGGTLIEDVLVDPENKTKYVEPPKLDTVVVGDFTKRKETHNVDAVEENSSNKDVPVVLVTGDNNSRNDEEMIIDTNPGPVHNFDGQIQEITGAWEEFQVNNGECFTKGCKWSPDGTCLLTNSDDNVLRIFDLPTQLHCQESWASQKTLPEMKPVLKMAEGGLIYDYCWYPLMSSWDPLSCCLVSTAQDNPVHLWDAFTGALRATYRAYNQVDEVEAAHCVMFDHTGDKLYCGFKNVIRIFNTAIPGRNCETRYLKDANIAESQRGIVSCIAVNPAVPNIYAVGSYLKSVGLYSEPRGSALCLMSGHGGGVTHLLFSPDGTKLFSGARKDAEIICWDIRNPGHVLFTMERKVNTNQRILFDVTPDGRHLVSGNSDGAATVWDLLEPPVSVATGCDLVLPPRQKFAAHKDCVNGVSIHQQYPIIATSSGQRHFAEPSRDSSDSDTDGNSPLLKRKYIERENCIKLWWTGKVTV